MRPRVASILAGALLLLCSLPAAVACGVAGLSSAGIRFGTEADGVRVRHPADRFPVDTPLLYMEIDSPRRFGATALTIQVIRQTNGLDQIIDSADTEISPDWNVMRLPLLPSAYGPGTYRVVASANGKIIASGTVTFY
jgi:hypothetical protein